jgi:DNA-binding transcriptional ArsR family regulator
MPLPSRDGAYGWPRQSGPDSRLSLLRELGEQAVLETIFRKGPITRPEIAAATNLSKPTVSAAVGRLEQGGLVRAAGRRGGQRGRNPVAYEVSSRAGFVVGGDIGGSNVRVAAADLYGEPICDLKHPTAKEGSRAVGVQTLEMVSAVIDEASAHHGRPLALGISAPGIVDQTSGRVTSLAYNVVPEGGFDPLEVIRDRFDLPVLVENNVNLAAIGEKWFGLARGVSTMVFIAIGAGIGMGIVIDDELVRGAHGAAGEIGYLPLVGDSIQDTGCTEVWRMRSARPESWWRSTSVAVPAIPSSRRSMTCLSSRAVEMRRPSPSLITLPHGWAQRLRPRARFSTRSW